MSSTSSDSSEDEEEARKIEEAVGIFNTGLSNVKDKNPDTPVPSATSLEPTFVQNAKPKTGHPRFIYSNGKLLKSKRPKLDDDAGEEEDQNVLKTTPEFRAYVAKQLSKLLEKELTSQIESNSWQPPDWIGNLLKEHGIKLFSDSAKLLRLQSNGSSCEQTSSANAADVHMAKKRRVSTSSSDSSSDEDAIQACVVSILDIEEENHRLSQFADNRPSSQKLGRFADVKFVAAKCAGNPSAGKNRAEESSRNGNDLKVDTDKERKKKKKRKKKKEEVNETKDNEDEKKIVSDVSENSKKVEGNNSSDHGNFKPKKKKKRKSGGNSLPTESVSSA